jgi:hypothetical protein
MPVISMVTTNHARGLLHKGRPLFFEITESLINWIFLGLKRNILKNNRVEI